MRASTLTRFTTHRPHSAVSSLEETGCALPSAHHHTLHLTTHSHSHSPSQPGRHGKPPYPSDNQPSPHYSGAKKRPITHPLSIIPTLAPCNTYRRRFPAQSRHPADQAHQPSSLDRRNKPTQRPSRPLAPAPPRSAGTWTELALKARPAARPRPLPARFAPGTPATPCALLGRQRSLHHVRAGAGGRNTRR